MFGFIKKCVNKAGKAVKKVGKTISNTVNDIPIVGKPLSAVTDLAISNSLILTGEILDGKRIDKAVISNIKKSVDNVETLGPYIQTVISLVPGVGSSASAAIGAGIALAEGKPIDAAIIAGVRGSIPGGPLATATFDVAVNIGQGKPLDKAVINSIPGLTDEQKKALVTSDNIIKDILDGKRIDETVYENAVKLLPKEARTSLQVGIAIGQGKSLQSAITKNISTKEIVKKIANEGKTLVSKNKPLKEGEKDLSDKEKSGYHVGVAVMANKVKNQFDFVAIRRNLTADERIGFDLACAVYLGNAADNKLNTYYEMLEKGLTLDISFNRINQMRQNIYVADQTRVSLMISQLKKSRLNFFRRIFI